MHLTILCVSERMGMRESTAISEKVFTIFAIFIFDLILVTVMVKNGLTLLLFLEFAGNSILTTPAQHTSGDKTVLHTQKINPFVLIFPALKKRLMHFSQLLSTLDSTIEYYMIIIMLHHL